MRSNLFSLFVRAFRPNEYKEHSLQSAPPRTTSEPAVNGNGNTDKSADPLERLRGFVVDLLTPQFRPASSLGTGISMFCPVGYPLHSYKTAIKALGAHSRNINNGTKTPSPTLFSANATITVSGVQIQCGPYGELHFPGGLTILPGCNPLQLYHEFLLLNSDQKEAVKKVLVTSDYCLILGLPGTGKTTALSLVVRALMARGERILLTSYTHAALDNLLLKIVQAGVPPVFSLRLGSPASVDPSLHRYLLDTEDSDNAGISLSTGAGVNVNTSSGTVGHAIRHLRKRCDQARLVACTVLSAPRSSVVRYIISRKSARNGNILSSAFSSEQGFQWCIVDEAGQISQPAAIGPLMQADRFVLVGDEYQLPPLVVSTEAQARGADVSLFKRLSEAHPAAVICLAQQHRMNSDIMAVCNTLIYAHRMKCASAEVANAKLVLPALHMLPLPIASASLSKRPMSLMSNPPRSPEDWLYRVLDPGAAVVFIDMDAVVAPLATAPSSAGTKIGSNSTSYSSSNSHGRVRNEAEAAIVLLLLNGLVSAGMQDLSQLGVVCPFRAQVGLIQQALAKHQTGSAAASGGTGTGGSEVEVSTVDRFQGRDKDVIILSTVRGIIAAPTVAELSSEAGAAAGGGTRTGTAAEPERNPSESGSAGDLLRDWRRINVAVTRARKKLIIIGSPTIMQQVPVLAALVALVRERRWLVPLPENALTMYPVNLQ